MFPIDHNRQEIGMEVVAGCLLYASVSWGKLCLNMQTVPLPESAEHQMSSRNHPGRQRLLDSPHMKEGVAAPHILLFCQSPGERSCLGTKVCWDVTVCVLASVFAARGIWGGSIDIHVPCRSNLIQQTDLNLSCSTLPLLVTCVVATGMAQPL